MIVNSHKIRLTCSLEFTEREVEMLGYMASFGGKAIAEKVFDKIGHKFSKEEWETLWTEMRSALEAADARFRDTRNVFVGNKKALWPSELERAAKGAA